jgi:hypothetical protein
MSTNRALKYAKFRYRGFRARWQGVKQEILWRFHPDAVVSRRRIRSLKNIHQGERCFIIGNGPSLKHHDLSLLKNEKTFGLNRIYLLFDEIGYETTYHVVVNRLLLEQSVDEIAKLSVPEFVSWHSRDTIDFRSNIRYLRSIDQSGPRFFTNIENGIWEGATVTYVAMQLAFYMGFSKVILLGVDHSFQTKGKPHTAFVTSGDDPNHFSPNYSGEGFRWNLPDLECSELAYRIADHVFRTSGREIVDATIGGKLDVFSKVDYVSLFSR